MKYGISALALAAALALSACGQPVDSQSDTPTCCKIGISFPTTALAYRQKMLDLLKQYDQAHPEVEFLIYDGESSQQKQNRDMLDMLENSVQGIILIPFTMEGPIPVIHYANEKNVPVLTLDNDVLHSATARTIGYVGSDHQEMGRQAAELLLRSLQARFPQEKQWNVLYLTGIADSSGAVDRNTGICSVLDADPHIRVIGTYNGQFTSRQAQSILEDCLQVYPAIHGIICQNDLMAEGCLDALENAGLSGKIAVVGIDGQRSVVQAIADQRMDGTVWQDPTMAVAAADRLLEALQQKTLSGNLYTDIAALDSTNAQEYLSEGLSW